MLKSNNSLILPIRNQKIFNGTKTLQFLIPVLSHKVKTVPKLWVMQVGRLMYSAFKKKHSNSISPILLAKTIIQSMTKELIIALVNEIGTICSHTPPKYYSIIY